MGMVTARTLFWSNKPNPAIGSRSLGDRSMRWMEACYGGTGVMERPCAMARGKDINISCDLPIMHFRYGIAVWPYC
jgi:hypothetical protein